MESTKRNRKKRSEKTEAQVQIADKVTYSESVKINCGDWESRDVFVSYSANVDEDENLDEAYKRCKDFVREKIRLREKKIRNHIKGFVDFDTKARTI